MLSADLDFPFLPVKGPAREAMGDGGKTRRVCCLVAFTDKNDKNVKNHNFVCCRPYFIIESLLKGPGR